MKKVRFESPNKLHIFKMNDSECHSPRPFLERELRSSPTVVVPDYPRLITFSNDPIQRYENADSSPYPIVNRTHVTCFDKEHCWKPSDDLNLSILDASHHEPRQPAFSKSILKESVQNKPNAIDGVAKFLERRHHLTENNVKDPPNVLVRDNSFFIKRDNLNRYHCNINPIQSELQRLSFGKENDPFARKNEEVFKNIVPSTNPINLNPPVSLSNECRCHHCIRNVGCMCNNQPTVIKDRQAQYHHTKDNLQQNCLCSTPRNQLCFQCNTNVTPPLANPCKTCNCQSPESSGPSNSIPKNAVDRKTWAIEKYEQSKQPNCMEVEKQKIVLKEKREPTVADLFKIIKLQNEQLQLLQEKVDKFMTARSNVQPTITCSTEHVAVNTVENSEGKMSVGVMTSFEMIRTSTVINKELLTQASDNAQIQCNKSQISIKEVTSKPVNMNFLDGIIPKHFDQSDDVNNATNEKQIENICDEKTLNEQSLYDLQVDNPTTPYISPEQSLYLDIRDYSDSEASNNDQSNVGWTYYNKVMTHVNGMLQDSEMPSSASALYRNMRQQCVQMHIDTTNVSVTKSIRLPRRVFRLSTRHPQEMLTIQALARKVKFGDDPLGVYQGLKQPAPAPSTDTSLKMNQLAAKYLKRVPPVALRAAHAPPATAAPIDMSFATRNYMEKHRLLQGLPGASRSPQAVDLPRFLDITALKQQPKFL